MNEILYKQFIELHKKELIEKAIREFNKKEEELNEIFVKLYKIDEKSFEEILYKFYNSRGQIKRIISDTMLDLETLVRLIRILLKNKVIKINKNGEIKFLIKMIPAGKKSISITSRPKINLDLNQHPSTLETAKSVAKKIFSDMPQENNRIVFLGDDNLISIYLASISNINIDVLDFDKKTLEFIDRISKKSKLKIKTHIVDLNKKLPCRFHDVFDAFVCDPPYNAEGVKLFVYRGWEMLKKEMGCKSYLMFSPFVVSNKLHEVQKFIIDLGFQFEQILPSFNKYPILWDYSETESIKKFAKDFKVNTLELEKFPFLFSNLFVLKLFDPKVGENVELSIKNIYDYYSI